MSNTITAFFKGRVGVAESVYQNDSGMVMVFDGIELPAHFDCYFSKLNQEEALPGVGAYDGEDNRVAIPNEVLADPGTVTVHIPLHTGANDSEVEYIVYFKVIGRARPIDDGTPTQMTAIEQALALLQNPITNIEQIVNEALAFTGETFEEMQEDLDEWKEGVEGGLTTWKGGVESDFDNLEAQFDTAVAAVTTDTEVTNIRVGDDNVIYTTAGEAVRTQFYNVKADLRINGYMSEGQVVDGNVMPTLLDSLDYISSAETLTYTANKTTTAAGTIEDFSSSKVSQMVSLDEGCLYHIKALAIGGGSPFILYDVNGDVSGTLLIPANATATLRDYYFIASQKNASIVITSGNSLGGLIEKITILETKAERNLKSIYNDSDWESLSITYAIGKLLNRVGVIVDYPGGGASWSVSDEIDISSYAAIKVKASTGYENAYYALYDSDHNFISAETSGGGTSEYQNVLLLPQNVKYIRISKYGSSSTAFVKRPITFAHSNAWFGKKWVCIGDSLTEANSATTKHYFDYVADETGITTANYGVGGTGYINPNGSAGNFTTRMASVPTDADAYTIFGSLNDYEYCINNSIPIGEPTDLGTSTVCGYINNAFSALFARVPLANLGVVAPCPWVSLNPVTSGTTGKTFAEKYVEALRLCCERMSIPFLDLYHHSGMRPWDSSFEELTYTKDGLHGVHPDETGHAILAPKFKAFLESLLM